MLPSSFKYVGEFIQSNSLGYVIHMDKDEFFMWHGAGIQYFMGYQSDPNLFLPKRWETNRQACWCKQAGAPEEDFYHC